MSYRKKTVAGPSAGLLAVTPEPPKPPPDSRTPSKFDTSRRRTWGRTCALPVPVGGHGATVAVGVVVAADRAEAATRKKMHKRLMLRHPTAGANELGRLNKIAQGAAAAVAAPKMKMGDPDTGERYVTAAHNGAGVSPMERQHGHGGGHRARGASAASEAPSESGAAADMRFSRAELHRSNYPPLVSAREKLVSAYVDHGDKHPPTNVRGTNTRAVLVAMRSFNGVVSAAPPVMLPHTFASHLRSTLPIKLTPVEMGALCRFYDTHGNGNVDFATFVNDFARMGEQQELKAKHNNSKAASRIARQQEAREAQQALRRTPGGAEHFRAAPFTAAQREAGLAKIRAVAEAYQTTDARRDPMGGLEGLVGDFVRMPAALFRERFGKVFLVYLTPSELGAVLETFDTDGSGQLDMRAFRQEFLRLRQRRQASKFEEKCRKQRQAEAREKRRAQQAEHRFCATQDAIVWPEDAPGALFEDAAAAAADQILYEDAPSPRAGAEQQQQQQQNEEEEQQQWWDEDEQGGTQMTIAEEEGGEEEEEEDEGRGGYGYGAMRDAVPAYA